MKTFLELLRDSALSIVFHVAPRFANVLIFILIGRLAGPDQAGIFSLATTYLLIVTTIMRGLDDLLIRQVAREPDRAAGYYANFLALRLVFSAMLYVALIFIVQVVLNYADTTSGPILVLTLSVLPDSLAFVAQSVLLGQRRFGAPAAILGGANVFKLIIGTIVLLRGGSLMDIAWIWLIGSGLAMIVLLFVAMKQIGGLRATDWLDFSPLKTHWRTALSFTAITVLTALDSQTDTVLLSIFRSEAEIGWYGAATTITFSLLMLAQAYRFAVYPLMTRHAQHAPERLARLYHKSMHYMGVVAMPMVVGIIVLAQPIVLLIFGPKFLPTVPVLQVLIVSLLFFFLSEPCNRVMLVKDRQRMTLGFLSVSASTNVVLNLMLIPKFGAVGAATARVCSATLYFMLNYGYVSRKLVRNADLKSLIRPAIATAIMAACAIVMMASHVVINIAISACVYFAALWGVRGIQREDANLLRDALTRRFR
jgi:O-antigen/teichoic acid export membrane protein